MSQWRSAVTNLSLWTKGAILLRRESFVRRCSATKFLTHTSHFNRLVLVGGVKASTLIYRLVSIKTRFTRNPECDTPKQATVRIQVNSMMMKAWKLPWSNQVTASSQMRTSIETTCKLILLSHVNLSYRLGSILNDKNIERSISAFWQRSRNDLRNRIQEILSRRSKKGITTITANHTEYDGPAESLCI